MQTSQLTRELTHWLIGITLVVYFLWTIGFIRWVTSNKPSTWPSPTLKSRSNGASASDPFYGGPEEGGWWGSDTEVIAYRAYISEEIACNVAEAVRQLATELEAEAQKEYGQQCTRELDWLEARGLDADWLPEPDGPTKYYVLVTNSIVEPSFGERQYSWKVSSNRVCIVLKTRYSVSHLISIFVASPQSTASQIQRTSAMQPWSGCMKVTPRNHGCQPSSNSPKPLRWILGCSRKSLASKRKGVERCDNDSDLASVNTPNANLQGQVSCSCDIGDVSTCSSHFTLDALRHLCLLLSFWVFEHWIRSMPRRDA